MKTKEEIRAYQKVYQKAYRESDKGKAYKKAYQKTDKSKAYQKAYRESDKGKAYKKDYQKDYQPAYFQRDKPKFNRNARNKINNLFLAGIVEKESCSRCGACDNLEFHHADYSKPLEVTILCRECHL